MSVQFKQFSAVLCMAASFSSPVFAQALAEEVVQELFDEMGAVGFTVLPNAKTVSGATVEWTDVSVTLPEDGGAFAIPFIRAEEIGGGQVSITYPDDMTFRIDPKGEQPSLDVVITTAGSAHIVSGAKNARAHNFSSEQTTVKVQSVEPALNMTFTMQDVISKQVRTGDEVRNSKGEFKAALVKVDYALDVPESQMVSKNTYTNVSAQFDVDAVGQENVDQLISGARNMSVTYSMDAIVGSSDITSPDMAMVMDVSAQSSKGTFAVKDGVFSLDGIGRDAVYNVKLKDLPLPPFSMGMEQMTTNIVMPLKQIDEPQPARVQLGFDGLKASDTVWGMIDPTGALPRDAARLNIDFTAQLKWLTNLLKLQEAQSMPAEVSQITINDITLDIAGATFNGVGSATLDNSKFPPEPVGEVNFDLKGGVGLLDKLVALGLVQQEQGQMVKMMSGMFTIPGGEGTDHLTSKIEMKEGGAILANGQRIK